MKYRLINSSSLMLYSAQVTRSGMVHFILQDALHKKFIPESQKSLINKTYWCICF